MLSEHAHGAFNLSLQEQCLSVFIPKAVYLCLTISSSLRSVCGVERAGEDDGVGGALNSSLFQFGDVDERCIFRPFLELLTRKQGRQTLGNGLPVTFLRSINRHDNISFVALGSRNSQKVIRRLVGLVLAISIAVTNTREDQPQRKKGLLRVVVLEVSAHAGT